MQISVHGVYDLQSLKQMQDLGADRIGFDLRPTSLNLIPFHILKSLISHFKLQQHYLIFENDHESTIRSFLDLLGEERHKFILQVRDTKLSDALKNIEFPTAWFFHPCDDYLEILSLTHVKEIFLPIEFQEIYSKDKNLWKIIYDRQLMVHLHAMSALDFESIPTINNLSLSFDLGSELEDSYRMLNQDRIADLNIWRLKNEITSGQ